MGKTEPNIHFWHTDPRLCGSTTRCRRATFDPNEVTCEKCMSRDTLELTEQGRRTLEGTDISP